MFIYFKGDIKDWWYNTDSKGKKGRNNLWKATGTVESMLGRGYFIGVEWSN